MVLGREDARREWAVEERKESMGVDVQVKWHLSPVGEEEFHLPHTSPPQPQSTLSPSPDMVPVGETSVKWARKTENSLRSSGFTLTYTCCLMASRLPPSSSQVSLHCQGQTVGNNHPPQSLVTLTTVNQNENHWFQSQPALQGHHPRCPFH